MKTFLAIYTCTENSEAHEAWKKLGPELQKERFQKGMKSLEQWREKNKNNIVFDGGVLDDVTKVVDNNGIREVPSQSGACSVVQANSLEEAAQMFVDHPHFAIFPGNGIEILERIDARDVGQASS